MMNLGSSRIEIGIGIGPGSLCATRRIRGFCGGRRIGGGGGFGGSLGISRIQRTTLVKYLSLACFLLPCISDIGLDTVFE